MNTIIVNKNNYLESMNDLKKRLYKIHCQNWIASKSNGTGAAGLTLEFLLGKERDNYALPDYNGIEIKTHNVYSNYQLHLFSCAFDNKPLESQRLLKIGGYPDKKNPQFKVFQIRVNAVEYKKVGNHSYRLYVDYFSSKLVLQIFYSDSLRLETEMSWSFEELKNRLVNKMSYLVVVNVKRYLKNDIYYYKYYNPTFYTLKNFSNFLWLVEKGLVCVSFKLTYVHYGERFGDFFDKGTGFELDYDHITSLFDIVDLGISF